MEKFIVEVTEGQKYTAGSKAKEDIVSILTAAGFNKISLSVPKNKLLRGLKGKALWRAALKKVKKNDIIVYQYPAYSRILGDYFLAAANAIEGCKKVVLIHDLDALRIYKHSPKDRARELAFLSGFDYVISHNETMTNWLKAEGVKTPILPLELFDYLEKAAIKETKQTAPVVFAGNLEKSSFLEKINFHTKMHLYGLSPAEKYKDTIVYKGAFSPDELGQKLEGSYGLVWDGDSVETCRGTVGEYMKYNNPHKVSLYLSLGIPVIIWKDAALSSFIEMNKVGVAIEHLTDLDERLSTITKEEYLAMSEHAQSIAKKLRSGYFITKVLNEIMEEIA